MPSYNNAQKKTLQNSGRSRGAVGGTKALVYRYIRTIVKKGDKVLDYGCGPKVHMRLLQRRGVLVDGYDLGYPPPVHCYPVVYASNVLNMQPSLAKAIEVVRELSYLVEPGGRLVVNYAADPEHHRRNIGKVLGVLRSLFREVSQVSGAKSYPVWLAQK